MILHPSSRGSFGDIVRFFNLFGTPDPFRIEDDYFGPDLHCRFHPEVPDWCLLKTDIKHVTILGQKLWHATVNNEKIC